MRLRILLILLSLWTCALLNPGNLGTVDAVRRLQVARWIRLGEPPVRPDDPGGGMVGRNGVRHPPFGLGQSLVMLPFDALASAAISREGQRFGLDAARRAQVIELAVAFLMQSFLAACTLILAYEVLRSFGFSSWIGTSGALALLFSTTVLQYVQSAQENLLLLALVLLALWAIRWYLQETQVRWAILAGLACSLAVLTRLPSILETGALACYALVSSVQRKRFLAGFLPPLVAALLLDRWYQYYRFGGLFSTYAAIQERQFRPPGAPEKFLFSYPFWKGFLGALLSPDKSILLFDPLLAVLIVLVCWQGRNLPGELKVVLTWLALLVAMYLAFFAKYYFFGGGVSWGDRYVLLPVQLLCLFAVPLLLANFRPLPGWGRRAILTIVFCSTILQAGSTAIAVNLEVIQRDRGYTQGAIWNRAVNLVEIARHREEPARFTGIPIEWRTLYYFPFQLRFRFPSLARWAIATWLALLACLPLLILAILGEARRLARQSKPEVAPVARIP